MGPLVVGVDVGTGSARAGLFDATGAQLARAERPIALRRPAPGRLEQDADDIWRAVCAAVRAARAEAGAAATDVRGIGFDATCSLVLRDAAGGPVPASDGANWDTIVWLDHRAAAEAREIAAAAVAGGVPLGGVSPEMQLPKLLWLKRHAPEAWARTAQAFDLADHLTWRATGSTARSVCTLTSKWGHGAGGAAGWPEALLAAVGLDDLPARAGPLGAPVPVGGDLGPLTLDAAAALGLDPSCRVAAGMVDAHAGALATLGPLAHDPDALARASALIAGTSSCVMVLDPAPRPLRGVWGPYPDVVLPGMWMREGGQSAAGALLDHLVRVWGGGAEPDAATHARIVARIETLRAAEGPDFAGRLHVLPDFAGNRAPLDDPRALGAISGLTLDGTFDGLCRLYWRAAVGIALGLRQVLDHFGAGGARIETLRLAGGHARNPLLVGLYADATGRAVVEPGAADPVLLGAGIVAAVAAGLHPDLGAAARAMARTGATRRPDPAVRDRFDRDYRAFIAMQRHRAELDAILGGD